MITLGDIFNDLQYGELNQFALTGSIDAPKGITPENYPQIISAINLGLTDLHTKLVLSEREVAINTMDILSYYVLDSRYSVHNKDPQFMPKYIQDSPDYPFTDDVIQIRRVWSETGCEYSLNDDNDEYGVFLVDYRTIQYPKAEDDVSIFVTYQANHRKIPLDAGLDTEIEIPEYLREALYAFVVERILSRSQAPEVIGVANAYRMKYEKILNDVQRLNTLNSQDNTQSNKFEQKGWV